MNTSYSAQTTAPTFAVRRRQTGVVLIFALVALTIMLVGAVALVSSFNTSLVATGNLAFKRDLQNQTERVVARIITEFSGAGALSDGAARASNLPANNYSAVALASNAQGIPSALLAKDSDFVAAGFSTSKDIVPGNSVKVRYVVDRLCNKTGNAQALRQEDCVPCANSDPYGMDESHIQGNNAGLADADRAGAPVAGGIPIPVIYRITIRAIGPRDTQAFVQTTFCEPLPTPAP